MKKFLLFATVVAFMTACSVEDEPGLYASQINDVDATYSGDDCATIAGEDKSRWIEISEAEAIESWDEVRKLYVNMLDPEVSKEGSFDPTIWEIIDQFHAQGLGDLTTTYTVTDGECSDSASLTVKVVPDGYQDPTCDAYAGEDNSITITEEEANALPSWDEVRKLYLSMLEPEVSRDGTFDPTIWDIINQYSGVGEYSTVYTVGEGECQDSVTLTVHVVPEEQGTPPCQLEAGPDNSMTITQSEAVAIPSWDEVRKLYLSLLPAGVSHEGIFDPSIWDIINRFQAEGVGEYTTTYTIGEGECTDSVNLTVFVVPDEQGIPPCGIDAGPDNSITITEAEGAAIPSWDEVRKLYLSLLQPGVSKEGTFDPSIWDIINRFQAERTGDFTTTYTIGEGNCSDSVELTITVI